MNAVTEMRNTLAHSFSSKEATPGSSNEAASGSTKEAVPGNSVSSGPETVDKLLQGIERVAAIFADNHNDPTACRLFCALAYHSGQEFPVKTMLGSIPAKGLQRDHSSVVAAMANLGFYAYRKKFAKQRWMGKRFPVLLVRDGAPFLLLSSVTDDSAIIYDGEQAHPFGLEDLQFEGENCWVFDFESVRNPRSNVARGHSGHSWIQALLAHFPKLGRAMMLLSALLALTGILLPVAISVFFGQVISLPSFSLLPYLIGGLVLISVFETLFIMQRARVVSWVASRLEYLVNTASFAQILQLPPSFSERAPPTSQAARLRSFESIRDFISGPAFASVLDVPVSIISLIFVGILSTSSLFIMLAAIVCFLTTFGLAWRKASVQTSVAADEATELQRIAIETLDKLEIIRSSGLQDIWSKRISAITERDQSAQMRLRFTGIVCENVSSMIYTISIICLMAEGAHAVWDGQSSGATLLALVILSLRILLPFHTLCLSVQRFEQIRRSLRQINSLMELKTEDENEREKNDMEPLEGSLSLVNVSFKAADTRPVFVGLDLEVEPGEVVGIYGANGSGKTTIFKMILGMVDIALGTARIDGVDLRQLPLNVLRRRISYVPQRPRIFPGTLRQNLAYANPLASPSQLDQVIEKVGLTAEVQALSGGLDHTIAGPDEDRLSASFRYRFAIARAMLVNSKLFLIDEIPNALLDGEVGELLRRLIADFRGQRTVVFISHRSDFLQLANRVIALRYGKVPIVSHPDVLLERLQ